MGEKVYVLGGLRSPIGLKNGAFKNVRPEALGARLLQEIIAKYDLAPKEVDGIYAGNAVGTGGNLARLASLTAGIPERVPAVSLDMQCASGLAAIDFAAAKVMSGQAQLVLAGGMESSSLQPRRFYAKQDGRYTPEGYMVAQFSPQENAADAMLKGAERTAQKIGATKAELDAWTLRSHARAKKAREDGTFRDILAPMFGSDKDEGIRTRMSQKLLERTRPLFAGGLTTAANACLTNDGAAFVALCSEGYCRRHGVRPIFELAAFHAGGGDPLYSPLAVHTVADGLLSKLGLSHEKIDAFEYNEAFGVIDVIFQRRHADLIDRYNMFGGALAYGHPYGASGAILLLHLLTALREKNGARGIAAIAGAGGLGAAVFVRRRTE